MAIDDLPLPVVNLLNAVGVPWPYIDEDVVSRFATFVREFGRAVQTTHDGATRCVAGIAAAYRGSSPTSSRRWRGQDVGRSRRRDR
jgi:hypothetical protein